MKGKLHIYRAGGALADPPEVREVAGPVGWDDVAGLLDDLHQLLEDDLEQIPMFDTVQMAGKVVPCVALCAEHGKIEGKPLNRRATLLWRAAMQRHADATVSAAMWLTLEDVLVGTVVILTGEREFLASL